jgi:hypothetical protein
MYNEIHKQIPPVVEMTKNNDIDFRHKKTSTIAEVFSIHLNLVYTT